MRHANRIAVAVLFLVPLCASWSGGSRPQVSKTDLILDKLTQQVKNYKDWGDFPIMLGHLAQKYELPMGIDLESSPKVKLTSVQLSRGTVAGLLTTLVSKEPDFDWTQVNGVINVTPRHLADSILDVRIGHFRVKNATPFEIHDAIVALPEVKVWLEQKHVTEATGWGGSFLSLPRASANLHDVTLRDILNTIVKSGLSSWTITRSGQNEQHVSISVG
ncbi:MAG: hypothetical protein ACRD40_11985 [Candidatus Acidiferrales bacterium]